ncbi:MAG TPA: hypothetical protein VNT75_13365 [Symbiobacteriaceae bacterium]|nr:hypothetical protein [Symbiobacteriaceae bacterium]
MDFRELSQAISEAVQQKDYARFKSLVDDFMTTAKGEDYAKALCLQADGYVLLDPKHAPLGFVLVGEALPYFAKSPVLRLRALTTALSLCYLTCDIERAREFEEDAYSLLLQHASDPHVRAVRHRLQLNLGQVATLRGDYSTAYWHFVQAANSLTSQDVSEAERRGFESVIQLQTALACLRVRRYYEAQEALDLAEQAAPREAVKIRAQVLRIELLRQLGAIEEARALTDSLADRVQTCDNPDTLTRYYWAASLLAQDSGDTARFHQLLSLAQQTAAEYGYDFLLSEIQRFLRTPL